MQRLPLVQGQRKGESVTALGDYLGHAVHDLSALEGRACPPARLRLVRRANRPLHILTRALRHGADHLARRRARRVHPRAALALGPLAGDEHCVVARTHRLLTRRFGPLLPLSRRVRETGPGVWVCPPITLPPSAEPSPLIASPSGMHFCISLRSRPLSPDADSRSSADR